MDGPITNFEFGKMQHREYETVARRNWSLGATPKDKPATPDRRTLLRIVVGIGFEIWLMAKKFWVNVRADAL